MGMAYVPARNGVTNRHRSQRSGEGAAGSRGAFEFALADVG